MDCASARDLLSPPERPRGSVTSRLRARRHVRECSACRDFFADEARLRPALRHALQQKAPPELRARVLAALAGEAAVLEPGQLRAGRASRTSWSRGVRWATGAAVLLIALALATLATRQGLVPPRTAQAGEIFIEDFLRRAVSEEQILSSDPAEVARFLTRELGRPAAPLVVPGLRIAKAEICLLDNRRGAMVLYDLDGTSVSHYLLARTRTEQPVPPAVRTVAGLEAEGLPAVVVWKTASLEHALVATMSPDELEALVTRAEGGAPRERRRLP